MDQRIGLTDKFDSTKYCLRHNMNLFDLFHIMYDCLQQTAALKLANNKL